MDFSVESNLAEVERGLSELARRELPFATSLALNATALDVRKNARKALERRLDRPTPFTLRAFRVRRSSKRRLGAAVFAMDAQAHYLRWAETGGTRRPEGRAIPAPAALRRNRFGNMPRGAIKRALAKPSVFSGDPRGPRRGGIYERTRGGGLRLLVHYASRASYRPRLGFQDGARKTAEARMAGHFERALVRALETAQS